MSLNAKTALNLIAGAVAGLLAWLLTDATGWFADVLSAQSSIGAGVAGYGRYLLYGALFGLVLGLLLGVVEALSLDSTSQMWATVAVSAGIGFFGGGLGLHLGQQVWGLLKPSDAAIASGAPGAFIRELVARAVGWSLIGAVVGAAQGASRRSPVIARQGAFGGFVGGALGGIAFQVTTQLLNSAVVGRLVALVLTGALIGFFVGLVQNLFKQAWIKVVLGKNEGKEYLVAKSVTTIGRSELSDIGLFGDKSIAPTHAVIELLPSPKRHRLRHVANSTGAAREPYPPTVVNGQAVTAEQWLADGDTIQIGARKLLFHERATRGTAPLPPILGEPDRASQVMPVEVVPPEAVAPPRFAGQELTAMSSSTTARDVTMLAGGGSIGTRLVCTTGPYTGQSFPLSHAPVTIGRATEREIALPADTSVSRTHAILSYENGQHIVADGGSSNGTRVNGQRLAAPQPLRAGDLITLGETTFRYE